MLYQLSYFRIRELMPTDEHHLYNSSGNEFIVGEDGFEPPKV